MPDEDWGWNRDLSKWSPLNEAKTEVEFNPRLRDIEMKPEKNPIVNPEGTTTAQSTLKPKAMPADELEIDKLFDRYSKLNGERRKEFIDYLQRTFADSAWSRNGAGVPDGTAEKNRKKLHKEEQETLDELLESFGIELREDTREKAHTMIINAAHKDDPFRRQLQKLVSQYTPSPFLNDYSLDTIERLALRVDELEGLCEMFEHQSEVLREEIIAKEQDKILKEEVMRHKRPARRSVIEETMLEPDESNADCLFNEKEKVTDPRMKRYVEYLDRTLGKGI